MTSYRRRVDYPKPLVDPVVLDDGRRVRLAGADYVPRLECDSEVHWVYEPSLRVGRAALWCHNRDDNSVLAAGWAEDVRVDLAGGSPCEVCAGLAPLPERGPDS